MMEKAVLVILFITGFRLSLRGWRDAARSAIHLRETRKRGFHPSDHEIIMPDSVPQKLSPEEIEQTQKESYEFYLKQITSETSEVLNYAVFMSGITFLSIYIYLQLTFKF